MSNSEDRYNYLEAYRRDAFAEPRFLEPIVFNDNNVKKVEILDEVKGWDQSKIDRLVGTKGSVRYHKYLVKCAKHNEFFQLIEDDPKPWSYRCYHCVTDEMNRVLQARMRRDADWKRKQTEYRRK